MAAPVGQSSLASRMLAHLRNRLPEMTRMLRELVEAESPSSEPDAVVAAQQLLFYALGERGFRVRRISGKATAGHLLAVPERRRRDRPIQLLIGHCDTVWPLGTLATMPVRIEEGMLKGPGAYDMKAGLVQALFAIDAVRALDIDLPVEPVIFVNSDEEIGSPESAHVIRRLARTCDRVFVLEPSLGHDGRLKTARKGVGRFTIKVVGRAAHAGLDPEDGASAILELSHVVQELFRLNDQRTGVTVNVGTIEGGIQPNVIAPESRARVDVRVLTAADADRIERVIFSLEATTPGTELVISGGMARPPLERTPGNRMLWERAVDAANELGIEIEQGTAGGGSDGNYTSLYAPTLDGLGPVGDGAHAAHEFVRLDAMPERAALLARLLIDPPCTMT